MSIEDLIANYELILITHFGPRGRNDVVANELWSATFDFLKKNFGEEAKVIELAEERRKRNMPPVS